MWNRSINFIIDWPLGHSKSLKINCIRIDSRFLYQHNFQKHKWDLFVILSFIRLNILFTYSLKVFIPHFIFSQKPLILNFKLLKSPIILLFVFVLACQFKMNKSVQKSLTKSKPYMASKNSSYSKARRIWFIGNYLVHSKYFYSLIPRDVWQNVFLINKWEFGVEMHF